MIGFGRRGFYRPVACSSVPGSELKLNSCHVAEASVFLGRSDSEMHGGSSACRIMEVRILAYVRSDDVAMHRRRVDLYIAMY